MKKHLILIIGIAFLFSHLGYSSENEPTSKAAVSTPVASSSSSNPMGKFELSVNPLGFLQFGPMINMGFGLSDNLVLTSHLRLPSAGLLSKVVSYDEDDDMYPDRLSGIAIGGGVNYFFTDNMSKPYIGGQLEYHYQKTLFAEGNYEEWEENSNGIVLMFNGGYRFRTGSGFFINTGAFLGFASVASEWHHTSYELSYTDSGEGVFYSEVIPFGMLEVSLGFEF